MVNPTVNTVIALGLFVISYPVLFQLFAFRNFRKDQLRPQPVTLQGSATLSPTIVLACYVKNYLSQFCGIATADITQRYPLQLSQPTQVD